MSVIAQTRGVVKRYGKQTVLRGIDMTIERGRIVGLIGPNGAGKTTLLRSLLGLTDFEGDLEVLGMDPRTQRAQMMERVCFIADIAVLPRWLRVRDALRFVNDIHPRFDREKARRLLGRTKIREESRVKELSKGMVAQLHLALVLAIDAEFLVLDEPTLGLDVLFRKQFYETLLTDYFDEQRTILVTTHQFEEVERILSDVMFIDDGEIVMSDSLESLAERFVEVLVPPAHSDAARALGAIHEREIFGKHVFLYENADREALQQYGELHTPSVTDIFVAKMQAGAA